MPRLRNSTPSKAIDSGVGAMSRQIEAAADQVDSLVAEMQIKGDLGISAEEIWKGRRDMLGAKRHGRRHPHTPARRGRLRQSLGLDRLRFGQDLSGTHRQNPAGFSQRQTARGAMEQALAETELQPGDRL